MLAPKGCKRLKLEPPTKKSPRKKQIQLHAPRKNLYTYKNILKLQQMSLLHSKSLITTNNRKKKLILTDTEEKKKKKRNLA